MIYRPVGMDAAVAVADISVGSAAAADLEVEPVQIHCNHPLPVLARGLYLQRERARSTLPFGKVPLRLAVSPLVCKTERRNTQTEPSNLNQTVYTNLEINH